MREYRAFYPALLQLPLFDDFRGLPLLRDVRNLQRTQRQLKQCFESWQHTGGDAGPLSGLQWEEFELAIARVRTTALESVLGGNPVLVPGVDLLNAETKSATNAVFSYAVSDDAVARVRAGRRGARAGAELTLAYCTKSQCGNDYMLIRWGFYLEANEFPILPSTEATKIVDCALHSCDKCDGGAKGGTRTGTHRTGVSVDTGAAIAPSLRAAVEAVLELDSFDDWAHWWRAPRCRPATLMGRPPQGRIHCNLARLSWEQCAQSWGYESRWQRPARSALQAAHLLQLSVPVLGPSLVAQAASVSSIPLLSWPAAMLFLVYRDPQKLKYVRGYDVASIFVAFLSLHLFCESLPLPGTVCFFVVLIQAACLTGFFAVALLAPAGTDLGDWDHGIPRLNATFIVGIVAHMCSQREGAVEYVGRVAALSAIFMLGAPLLNLRHVLVEHSHVGLPRARCAMGFVCSCLTTWAAFLHNDLPTIFYTASAAGLVLCCAQIALICVLPPKAN